MASGESAPNEPLDERLAEARDSALMQGEKIIAQETGDAGQAIVLTDSRVILLKAGITATGELNGQKIGAYALSEITAINVRTGPVGAVIQICSNARELSSQGGPPDNVIVFTGPQKVKKCEIIAAEIGAMLGKPVDRVEARREPHAQKKVPAQPTEAAVESASQAETIAEERVEPQQTVIEQQIEEELEEEEELVELRPNPNLPKPVRARSGGPGRMLVVIGALAVIVLVGMAITAPLREPPKPLPKLSVSATSKDPTAIRRELSAVSDYRKKAAPIVIEAEALAAKIEAGLRSGDRAALSSAVSGDSFGDLFSRFGELQAPSGLAGAKESVVRGLFGLKTVAVSISDGVQSRGDLDVPNRLAKIAEARASLQSGLKAVDAMASSLNERLTDAR